jgi:uncharacterized heparinase superfamily protein
MNVFQKAARLFRTLRHVPPRMLGARAAYRARCLYYASPAHGLVEGKLPPLPEALKLDPPDLWGGDAARGKRVAGGSFAFAGQTLELGVPPSNWFPAKASALWLFHLHYHDWLGDLRAANDKDTARRLLASWMENCPAWDPVAWHPYPLSLRLVNWLTHASWLLSDKDGGSLPREFVDNFWDLTLAQAFHLSRNTETWLEGNHLIKNLKALVYAGACLPGCEALLMQGLSGLLRALRAQVHEDGGHHEASPGYHAQVLQDVLDVSALLRKAGGVPPQLTDVAERMAGALAFYRHPDGGLALFNDGDQGEASHLDRLLKRAGGAEAPAELPQTGYVRLARGDTVAILDAGRVGPDANPGHAHADTLSFELSMGGERLIVNGGTYAYQHRLRNVFRGTATHATVSVDGEDSAEVWGVFRVGRRPRDVGYEAKNLAAGDAAVMGWHDGYRHIGARHVRKMVMAGDGRTIRGEDEVTFRRAGKRKVVGVFPLAPGVDCRLEREDLARLTTPKGKVYTLAVQGARLDVHDTRQSPRLGVLADNRTLVFLPPGKPGEGKSVKVGWLIKAP